VLGVVSLKPLSSTPYEVAADTALQDRVIDELVIFDVCTFAGAAGPVPPQAVVAVTLTHAELPAESTDRTPRV
jgi:hypothetical protein